MNTYKANKIMSNWLASLSTFHLFIARSFCFYRLCGGFIKRTWHESDEGCFQKFLLFSAKHSVTVLFSWWNICQRSSTRKFNEYFMTFENNYFTQIGSYRVENVKSFLSEFIFSLLERELLACWRLQPQDFNIWIFIKKRHLMTLNEFWDRDNPPENITLMNYVKCFQKVI